MKTLFNLIAVLFLSLPVLAQTKQSFNVDQIRPSTVDNYVLTTVSGHTVWAPAPGGGSGCTLGSVPNNAVLANHSGSCYGDTLFTYTGGSGSTGGTIDINNNTSVLLETGANLEIDSASNSTNNYWLMTGDHLFEFSTGTNGLGGIELHISDVNSTSGVGPEPIFVTVTESRAAKNMIGMQIQEQVANSIAAGRATGIEVDGPSIGASNSATTVWGFIASMAADSLATVEQLAYLAETPTGVTPNANYCDFVGRVHTGATRESIGCGASGLSTFNDPVALAGGGTVNGHAICDITGANCEPVAWSCQPGYGDGANAIGTGTYLASTCFNDTGKTITLTGFKCFTDNSGTSTMNVTNSSNTALLTGAVTCTSSFASGTQSATTTIAPGDYIKFTFAADGTSKQADFVVTGTHS